MSTAFSSYHQITIRWGRLKTGSQRPNVSQLVQLLHCHIPLKQRQNETENKQWPIVPHFHVCERMSPPLARCPLFLIPAVVSHQILFPTPLFSDRAVLRFAKHVQIFTATQLQSAPIIHLYILLWYAGDCIDAMGFAANEMEHVCYSRKILHSKVSPARVHLMQNFSRKSCGLK